MAVYASNAENADTLHALSHNEGDAIKLSGIFVGIKGTGEMASAVACRLFKARIRNIFMMEVAEPLAVRRKVSFCEAVHQSSMTVEGVGAHLEENREGVPRSWKKGRIAVFVDPLWRMVEQIKPHVVIDGILVKKT